MCSRHVKEFRTAQGVFIAGPDDVLGKGTYGMVYKVHHRDNPEIKKAVKTFTLETLDENEGVPSTTLREVNAVKSIDHPNVMSVEEVVIPPNNSLAGMFLVMELCRGTLKEKVLDMISRHLGNDPKWVHGTSDPLPAGYVQEAKLVAWQILNAVAVCHSRGIMHRDLKPANIMWSDSDLVKIGDFGLARFVRGNPISKDHIATHTSEVQTMWYRAPEVILGDDRYGMLVDDWSVGCILAELFRFKISPYSKRMEPDALFSGRGDIHTALLIFESLGTPDDPYLKSLPYYSVDFPKWTLGTLRKRTKYIDDVGYSLLLELLQMSPTHRKASRFLLNHPWFDDVRSIVHKKYVPWYRGCEEEYIRLLEVDRLPAAKPLAAKTAATTPAAENDENAHRGRKVNQCPKQTEKNPADPVDSKLSQENKRVASRGKKTAGAKGRASSTAAGPVLESYMQQSQEFVRRTATDVGINSLSTSETSVSAEYGCGNGVKTLRRKPAGTTKAPGSRTFKTQFVIKYP